MALKIRIYKLEDLDKNLKATVHRTGKLGFTSEAAKKMNLSANKSIDIGHNEIDLSDTNLYLFTHSDENKGQFRVVKAGKYYYINTKPLFDTLRMDYISDTVSFNIVPEEIEGERVFVLKRRLKTSKVRPSGFDEDES